jgi:glycosyltransferase involved in cell wall biosynthesis
MNTAEFPLISCLMVTGNRKALAARAIACFRNQTWPNKELVIIDDGTEDLSSLFVGIEDQVQYIRLEKRPENVLGMLRNKSLDAARGVFLAQWDDDDWYHPDRLKIQAEVLMQGNDACCLHGTLMHLDDEVFGSLPYVGYLKNGVPGSIMHRNSKTIRYPEIRRAEDTYYLNEWRKRRYVMLGREHSDKFIRCFHGSNTWEKAHFRRRIRNTPIDAVFYVVLNLFGKLEKHPRFKLQPHERAAFASYVNLSAELGLLQFPPKR